MWLLRRGWRLIVAGYYPVEFADFWLADQLNSLAAVILDLEYMSCFFRIDGGLNGPNEGTVEGAEMGILKKVSNISDLFVEIREFKDSLSTSKRDFN